MQILILSLVAGLVAIGGLWIATRDTKPVQKHPMKKDGSVYHEEATIQEFKDNPQDAAAYLSAVLEDGDQEEVLLALRRITTAFGGELKLTKQTDLNAKTLYRTLSARGNPEMKSLTAILKAMGMRLAVEPIETAHATANTPLTVKLAAFRPEVHGGEFPATVRK